MPTLTRLDPDPVAIPCKVSGHNHDLLYLYTYAQGGGVQHRFQCPQNNWRFWFRIELGKPTLVEKQKKPAYGFGAVKLDDGRIITAAGKVSQPVATHLIPDREESSDAYSKPTAFQGCTAEEMGF